MTTIIDNRNEKLRKCFDQLEIGDFYEDYDGNICLKISHSKCLYNRDGRWENSNEIPEDTVYPLLATITIERG